MPKRQRLKTEKACEVCTRLFRPWRQRGVTCSHACRSRHTAKLLGKAHYKRLGKAAWTPQAREKRQPTRWQTPDYKRGYSAGWVACERFYRKAAVA